MGEDKSWRGVVFPKKSGAELEKAVPFVNEVYGCYGNELPPGPQGSRAIPTGTILHITRHSIPHKYYGLRVALQLALICCWGLLYPREIQIRTLCCALAYSFTECAFTAVERRKPYTSMAQFWGNLLYLPVLLDGYGLMLEGRPIMYVVLFPLNIWILEVVLHWLFVAVYGHNVAWCYMDYSDEYLHGVVRLGHAPAWWILGLICLNLYPVLRMASLQLASTDFSDRDATINLLWDICGAIHSLCVQIGLTNSVHT